MNKMKRFSIFLCLILAATYFDIVIFRLAGEMDETTHFWWLVYCFGTGAFVGIISDLVNEKFFPEGR